jgi:hypothetical protein
MESGVFGSSVEENDFGRNEMLFRIVGLDQYSFGAVTIAFEYGKKPSAVSGNWSDAEETSFRFALVPHQ